MYYEEAEIDGVLCCRNHPDGPWTPLSPEALTLKLREVDELRKAIWHLLSGGVVKDDPTLERMVYMRGCQGKESGNPMDGFESLCEYDLIGSCEDCPVVYLEERSGEG